ncbi:MAG: PKD domain-containing protein [Calditrichia bacterium]
MSIGTGKNKKTLLFNALGRLRITVLLFVSVFLFTMNCGVVDPQPMGNIVGTITDSDGNLLAGVAVTTDPETESATSGPDGKYKIEGVEPASYTVIANKEGYLSKTGRAAVKVDEDIELNLSLELSMPSLNVSSVFVNFESTETTRTFQIENDGTGSLNWNIVENEDWIESVTPDSGTAIDGEQSTTVTMTASRTNLPNGLTNGFLTIFSDSDTFTVTTAIIKGAAVQPSTQRLSFSGLVDQQTLTLKNLVPGTLTYGITSDKNWLTTTPISGSFDSGEETITVAVDRNNEPFGTQYGHLFIESNGGKDTLLVAMTVTNPNAPQIFVPVNSLDFGSSIINYQLPLSNSGVGTLTWEISDNVSWLEAGLESGIIASEATISVPLTVDRSGLSTAGNPYQGELTLTSNDPNTSSLVFPLTMLVEDRPVLSISDPYIDLGLEGIDKDIFIGNSGSGDLSWSAVAVENWISISPTSGGNNSAVQVAVNRNNSGFGHVSGAINVQSNGGVQQIVVALENRGNNTAPLADFNINPESGRLETIFSFDASITTDDYDSLDALEFRWRWYAGGVFTDWATSPFATHQYITSGTKQVTLEARDTNGATRAKNRNLQVIANAAPTANFTNTPTSGTTSDVFTFNAANSFDDVDSLSALRFRWRFGSAADFTEWSSDTLIDHQFTTNANHQVTLEVIDSDDAIGTRTKPVSVSQNPAPTASFTVAPPSGTTVTVFEFDAGASMDDRNPIDSLLFRWRWETSEPWTDWSSDTLASHRYTSNGSKQVMLEVMDTDSAVGTRNRTISVASNPAPTANFSFTPNTGTTVTVFEFDAGASMDDTDPIEVLDFRWRWEAGADWTEWSNDTLASHQYSSNGNKTITLQVRDTNAAVGERNRNLTVSQNPAPDAVFTFDPPTGTPAMQFTFNSGGSSDDTDPIESLQFRWEFGAGNGFTTWSNDTLITHQFTSIGDQQVTLEVRDLAGAASDDEQIVPVVANQEPTAAFDFDPQDGTVETIYNFDASASVDDFTPPADLEFRWRWTANSTFTAWSGSPLADHQFTTTGSKEVTLEVRDGEDSVGSIAQTLEVLENQPPNAIFVVTPENGTIATLFQFDASGSMDDVTPLVDLEFRWRWENGGAYTDWSNIPTAEHQYATDGQKTVKLEVRDTGALIGGFSDLVLVGAAPVTENEPNDTRGQADAIGETTTVFGEIGVAGDEDDWFAITVPANGKLWYRLENLEVSGASSSRIAESPLFAINELLDAVQLTSAYVSHGGSRYIGPGEAATSVKTIVAANRTYYVQIPQYTGHSAQYELRMFFSELSQSDLGEDNDAQSSAFVVAANQFHQAHNGFWKNGATKEDQQDWYELQFTESGVLQYTVENLHNEAAANGYVDETIFHSATTFDFIELTRAGINHGGGSRYIAPTEVALSGKVGIDKGREFYLQIPQFINHAAPYEFQVNFVPSMFTDFGEDNDQSNSAAPIDEISENTAEIGYIKSAGQYDEKDWYSPQVQRNGLLQITIENLYSTDILNGRIAPSKVYLKNILDFLEIQTLQVNHGGNNNYIGAGESVVSSRIAVSTDEDYFLEIPQYLTDRHQAPYKVTTTIIPTALTALQDTNDTRTDADTIAVNDIVTASIGYEDDEYDWYTFSAPASGSFQFSVANNHVTGVIGGRIATCLLFDNLLAVIGTATVNHGGNNNYIDAAETATSVVIPVVGGTRYYIQIIREEQDVAPYTMQTSFSQ